MATAYAECFDPTGARYGLPTSLGMCVLCADASRTTTR